MTGFWKGFHPLALGAALLAGEGLWAQDKTGKDDKNLPPIDVVAPKTPAAVEQPPTLPPPQDPATLGGNAPFTYNGSPLGDFGAGTSSLNGAPTRLFDLPNSATILDRTRIDQSIPLNTPSIFQGIPGVMIQRTNAQGGSLIMRGRNGNQDLIMVDGIPLNDAAWRFGNVQYLNTVDPGIIDRVEVMRGANSVMYGSGALGGVVNIITKKRNDFSQSIDAGGGFLTRVSTANQETYNFMEVQGNFRNMGVYAGGSYLSNGSLFAGQGVTFPESATGYDQRAMDVRVDTCLGDGWIFTLGFQHLMQPKSPRTDRFPLPQVDPTRFVNRPTWFQDQERNLGYLRLARYSDTDWINGLEVTASVQQRREIENEFRRDVNPRQNNVSLEDILYGGLDFRAYTDLSQNNTLSYGASYYHDSIDATRKRQLSNNPRYTFITPGLPPDGEYGQFGVFMMDRHVVGQSLALNAGLRYSHIEAKGTAGLGSATRKRFDRNFDVWSAEGGAVLAVTDEFHLVGRVAQGFRAPNLEDLGSVDRNSGRGQDFGSTTLDPEFVTSFEGGFKYQSELFTANFSYWYDDVDQSIVRTVQQGSNIRVNSRGYLHGLEFEGALRLTKAWSLYGVASTVYGQDTLLNEPMSRIPGPMFVMGSRWACRTSRVGLYLDVFAEMMGRSDRLSTSDKTDIRIPVGGEAAWQTFNIQGGLDGGRWGKLNLGLYNVFNQNYRYLGSGVDAPGIDFRVGYELNF